MLIQRARTLSLLPLLLSAASCGGDEKDDAGEVPVMSEPPSAPGTDATIDGAATGGDEPGSSGGGGEGALGSSGLPCAVQEILAENCSGCHADTPRFGAPMSLVDYDDLRAPAVSDGSRSVSDLVLQRVSATNSRMPPVPNAPLSAEQIAALSAWVNGGAPRSDETCLDGIDEPALPTGGFANAYPDEAECDAPIELRASDAGQAFEIPLEDDRYECFYFNAPTDPRLALGFKPQIDNDSVIHHWLLYAVDDASLEDGTHESCVGLHPNSALIAGWAPGGQAYGMPEDVGLELPSGESARFILEIHYNNIARAEGQLDRSGVTLCATRESRENIAAVHWLGTENITLPPGESDAGSTCNPELDQTVTLLSVTPHMHQLGSHARIVINRADGSEETLLDEPFEFSSQVAYGLGGGDGIELRPGDSITSTCTWNNTSGGFTSFGEGTSDEMCYMFLTAYPGGLLNTGGDFAFFGLLPGENKCMR